MKGAISGTNTYTVSTIRIILAEPATNVGRLRLAADGGPTRVRKVRPIGIE